MRKRMKIVLLIALIAALLCGCASTGDDAQSPSPSPESTQAASKPALPEKLTLGENGVPVLTVYQVDEEATEEMDIETYLQGVLAGEMKNDWPMEALKAQAILARTFVLKFCTEKESKYEGADISTDIEEAQAYDATGVNERIVQAVEETRGMVLSQNSELPYAWFHAHSGGMTALAKEGLGWEKDEPGYTQVVQGNESDNAPADAKEWQATFGMAEFLAAAKKAGAGEIKQLSEIAIGQRGDSGRATTILLDGAPVAAPELRIALGSSKMRSTLLTSLKVENGSVVMAGKGYGHGVGMTQWGAYGMAEDGKKAKDIVSYYFKDVTVETLW